MDHREMFNGDVNTWFNFNFSSSPGDILNNTFTVGLPMVNVLLFKISPQDRRD